MSENWGLWACILIYSLTLFCFGGFIEWKIANAQLPAIVDKAWLDGCKQCAQFEKNKCERDQLQIPESLHINP